MMLTRPLFALTADNGAAKRLRITRKMLNGTEEEKIVTVNIKPGWKAGTKVRYAGMGTELRNGPAADIVCESMPYAFHPRFRPY